MRQAYGDRRKLSPALHAHYLRPLATPDDRRGTWAYAQALLGASDWYESLWQRRERIATIPTRILWGMRDIAFRETELQRLETVFTHARTVRFADAGHFVQEEKPLELSAEVRAHLTDLAVVNEAVGSE
jgi:haloalkane dehalogenase